NVACPVAVRKELAVALLVQWHAELVEERDGVANRPSAKNTTHDRAPAAPEVGVGDGGVGDVAPRAAAHKDLRARTLRAVDEQNGQMRMKTSREDCRGQAGGSSAENGHVGQNVRLGFVYAAGAVSCLLTVEIAPHAPHRTLTRFGSSVIPII